MSLITGEKPHSLSDDHSSDIVNMTFFDLQSIPGRKRSFADFSAGYSDLAIEAAVHFEKVVIIDNRIPNINFLSSKIKQLNLNNIDLINQDVLTFSSKEKFDCIALSQSLASYGDEKAQLQILLRVASLLSDNGVLLLSGSEKEVRSCRAIAGLIGFEFESYLKSADEKLCVAFRLPSPQIFQGKNDSLKVACFGSMPFHFRSLKPLAKMFSQSIVTLSIDEVLSFKPDVIAVADGWSVEFWRDYCDAHNVQLIGMRHGSVTRYGFAESQYNYADYMCGSPWDIEDTLQSNVLPRKGFIITGNSWVDQVFQIEKKKINNVNPTILFAPTYNPEISAAVFFGERVVDLIRNIYPDSRIIIKPHPAIVQHEHSFVVDKAIFRDLMNKWREQSQQDPLVELIDDPEASIATSFAEADILLADASSLIYEFMTLDRPIILYSADAKVAHWEYNPNAPGNAWRDIGLQFNDEKTFIAHLKDAFRLHDKLCRRAQADRTAFLHGDFQDGCSINRVATAIVQQPALDVIIYGDNSDFKYKKRLASQISDWLAFARFTIIDVNADFTDLQDWHHKRDQKVNRHHAVLMINADQSKIPASAHQITQGLREMARGKFSRLVMRTDNEIALALMHMHDVGNFISNNDDENFLEKAWDTVKLNVTPLNGVVRNPGQHWFKVDNNAHFRLTPAILGIKPVEASVWLNVSLFDRAEYDHFPFITQIEVNGRVIKEEVIDNIFDRVLMLPFVPDDSGVANVRILSSSGIPTARDFIKNVVFSMRSSQIMLDEITENDSGLDGWLAARKPSNAQAHFISEYELETAQMTYISCLVVVKDADDNLIETLENLKELDSRHRSLKLQPLILNVSDNKLTLNDSVVVVNCAHKEIAEEINKLISEYASDWFIILNAGEKLTDNGAIIAKLQLPLATNCAAVYGDAVLIQDEKVSSLAFHPDFNLDLLLSIPGIMADHWLFKRETFIELDGFSSDWSDAFQFEYITRIIECKGIGVVGHLDEPFIMRKPYVLRSCIEQQQVLEKHLLQRGYENAAVESHSPGVWRLKYNVTHTPLVSIIIPTKDQLPILITCVTTLLEKTSYLNYEIIIVDNNSELIETQEWLKGIAQVDPARIRVLSYPYPFNYSSINNLAVEAARGEYIVLLNNDTAIIQNDWLENMLNHAQRPEVGIVGAKLLYPNGRIQHAGVVLGLRGPADHPFIGRPGDDKGYLNRLIADQNYTTVTAACMMVRKDVYQAVGGLDEERFRVSYNDVDFCLKVREQGYLTVWTPYATVMHEGSVSQKKVDKATQDAKIKRFTGEQDLMYEKWLPLIAKDPSYNANLTLGGEGFELLDDSSYTWKPVFWRAAPTVMAHMADLSGCGYYRIIKPFEAMEEAGLVQGKLSRLLINLPQLTQYDADSIILQRQITPEAHDWIARLKKFSRAFKVFELDDYLPNLPVKNMHRVDMPKDIVKSIRKSLSMVDRFVVSTPVLADAFSGYHPDIRVAENRLPVNQWGSLSSLRGQGRKPRVGWAGGASHTGDLEMMVDVVRALSDRVEWVFMGMCPPRLRPYIHEYHTGVDIDAYPEKLASLNLDLAIAPVEDNLFNRCKSNLRLLEYGACGFPVIASDVECYRYNLPVTLVRNRYKDWVEAIEMHLNDCETSWRMGDALREAVRSDWLLTGEPLRQWAKLWLPD
ncbi:glycosyltransferase [Pantoea sp. WEP]|uniref:glycosyltransferase n=1 Tax=Pantoea sp. WEP TaxID=3230025 RepID=UPI003567D195